MLRDADRELELLEKELLKDVPAPKVTTPKNLKNTAPLPKVKQSTAPLPKGNSVPVTKSAQTAAAPKGNGIPVTQSAAKPRETGIPVTQSAQARQPAQSSEPVVYKNYANNYGKDLRNAASGYQSYSEKPQRVPVTQRATTARVPTAPPPKPEPEPVVQKTPPAKNQGNENGDLKLIIGLLIAAIICVVLYWLLNFVFL